MRRKHKNRCLIITISIIIILVIAVAICYSIKKDNHNNVPASPINNLINNKEEAINFAKADKEFNEASNRYILRFNEKLIYSSNYYEEDRYWEVSVSPDNTGDVGYFIDFYSNGTIIKRDYWREA